MHCLIIVAKIEREKDRYQSDFFLIRLQETMVEQNKLYKQLENSEFELQSQKNELNTYIKEKMVLVKVCCHIIFKKNPKFLRNGFLIL